jgi:glycosyltransferase involved in cell wall biosynthesis
LEASQVTGLRRDGSSLAALVNFIPSFLATARAARRSQTVHSAGAGWPFPPSYYLLALRPFLRRDWVMVIESSFWMLEPGQSPGLKARLRHALHDRLVGACLRRAEARIVTQPWYRDRYLGPKAPRTLVAPAVWIAADQIATKAGVEARRAGREGPVRLIFPARLVAEKGVETLISAILEYEKRIDAPQVEIAIIGTGPLEHRCRSFAASHQGRVQVRFLDPVPYGAPFFDLIGAYDAVLLANRQAEQPRIVFDANAQGLPVISSATPGVMSLVEDGKTGWLYAVEDAPGLAALVDRAARGRAALEKMGDAALDFAADKTHRAMHEERADFLARTLPGQRGGQI